MFFKFGQRRDFFVKKWFQTRIILYYLLILLAGGSALAYVIYRRAVATLRYCLFRGHSRECSTWELLREQVVDTNVTATIIAMALAIVAVFLISWAVARAAGAVTANVRAALSGRDPATWRRPPRPHEFRILQNKLAAGLAGHQERIDELRGGILALRQKIRQAREDLERGTGGGAVSRSRELHAGFENLKNLYKAFKVREP